VCITGFVTLLLSLCYFLCQRDWLMPANIGVIKLSLSANQFLCSHLLKHSFAVLIAFNKDGSSLRTFQFLLPLFNFQHRPHTSESYPLQIVHSIIHSCSRTGNIPIRKTMIFTPPLFPCSYYEIIYSYQNQIIIPIYFIFNSSLLLCTQNLLTTGDM
jgi:hypothetical protein